MLSGELDTFTIYIPIAFKPEPPYEEPPYKLWINAYDGSGSSDYASDVIETNDGGFAVVGCLSPCTAYHPGWLAKLNQDGSISWQIVHQIGGPLTSVVEDSDGNIIAAGGDSDYDIITIVKHNSNGNMEWKQHIRSDVSVKEINLANDGGYVIAGDEHIYKVNSDGSLAWLKRYGEGSRRFGAVQSTDDGGYIVAGKMIPESAVDYDGWVLKLKSDGSIAWQKTYDLGDGASDGLYSIRKTNDGGYIAIGEMRDQGWLLKLRGDGTVDWSKGIGGADRDGLMSVQQTKDGGYVASGWSQSFCYFCRQAWAIKVDENGDLLWERTYSPAYLYGPAYLRIKAVKVGGYIAAAGGLNGDAVVMRLDDTGYMPDCNMIDQSVSQVIDYDIIDKDVAAAVVSFTPKEGGSSYVREGAALLIPICPESPAINNSCR